MALRVVLPVPGFIYAGPKSFTGCDLIEIIIPGSALVQIALDCLTSAGAIAAPRNGFTRQAVALAGLLWIRPRQFWHLPMRPMRKLRSGRSLVYKVA